MITVAILSSDISSRVLELRIKNLTVESAESELNGEAYLRKIAFMVKMNHASV